MKNEYTIINGLIHKQDDEFSYSFNDFIYKEFILYYGRHPGCYWMVLE